MRTMFMRYSAMPIIVTPLFALPRRIATAIAAATARYCHRRRHHYRSADF